MNQKDREVMRVALDALELECRDLSGNKIDLVAPAIKALRDRLAQPEPEPVAWRYKIVPPAWTYSDKQPNPEFAGSAWERWQVQPLYAAPRKGEWVGLTEEEFFELLGIDGRLDHVEVPVIADLIRAVQSKLKGKNYD